jgi:glycosyltransferase involved in cell wall biosynthesis
LDLVDQGGRLPWRLRQALMKIRRRLIAYFPARRVGQWPDPIGRAVVVSHDLTASGAPRVAFEITRDLIERGLEVLVFTREDGPFRATFQAAGASVVLQGDLITRPQLFAKVCQNAKIVILNTTVAAPLATQVGPGTSAYIYLHEISSLRAALTQKPDVRAGLIAARGVWAGNADTAEVAREVRRDVTVFPYGLDPALLRERLNHDRPVVLHIFGSYEARKGQDLALEAVRRIAVRRPGQLTLKMNGRVLQPGFFDNLKMATVSLDDIEIGGALDHEDYLAAMEACDIVLVPSRDDTLPLVSLDALSGGRVLVCTATTGTAAYIQNGVSGFIAAHPTVESLEDTLDRALAQRAAYPEITRAGGEVFRTYFSREAFSHRLADELGLPRDRQEGETLDKS